MKFDGSYVRSHARSYARSNAWSYARSYTRLHTRSPDYRFYDHGITLGPGGGKMVLILLEEVIAL